MYILYDLYDIFVIYSVCCIIFYMMYVVRYNVCYTFPLISFQLFTEYGKLATSDVSDIKPFQSLLFLVRDWSRLELPLRLRVRNRRW